MATAANDVIRMIAGYAYGIGGKPLSNVFHMADTGGGGITDANLLSAAGSILENILGGIVAVQSDTHQYVDIQVQNLTQNLIIGTIPWPAFTVGSLAEPVNPAQVTALVQMVTPTPRVQGRVYVTGLSEFDVADSAWSVPVLNALAQLGVELLTPRVVAPSELTYCVFNQVLKTFTLPTSTALRTNNRGLNRRKIV